MKKINWRNHIATIGGLITSIGVAYQVIDINTFDIKKDWFKLIILALPAIGGYLSSITKI